MQVFQGKILSVTFENEEVDILESILVQLLNKKVGFVRTLDLEQLELMNKLYEQIKEEKK